MTDKPPFKVTAATVDVLEVLLSGDDELYGLKIAKATGLNPGSVARAVTALVKRGLLSKDGATIQEVSA